MKRALANILKYQTASIAWTIKPAAMIIMHNLLILVDSTVLCGMRKYKYLCIASKKQCLINQLGYKRSSWAFLQYVQYFRGALIPNKSSELSLYERRWHKASTTHQQPNPTGGRNNYLILCMISYDYWILALAEFSLLLLTINIWMLWIHNKDKHKKRAIK